MGHSRAYVGSRRFLSADGGILRVVWMTQRLKEALRMEIEAAAAAGHPDFWARSPVRMMRVEEEEVLGVPDLSRASGAGVGAAVLRCSEAPARAHALAHPIDCRSAG